MADFHQGFIEFAVRHGVIRFGEFTTKAGRCSPYFFNAGLFHSGRSLQSLCGFYADAILDQAPPFDFLFGPAYKGIPLVAGIAIELAHRGRDVAFCFNRKEAKDHGEGGVLVGAPARGRALIVDDVISAGTSIRESVGLLEVAGATPVGVVIALDRMERGSSELSAVQEVRQRYAMPVISVATLDHLVAHLERQPRVDGVLDRLLAYRERYGQGV